MHIPFIHPHPHHKVPLGHHPVTLYDKVIPSSILPWDFSLLKQYNIFLFQMFQLKIISIVYRRFNCSKLLATTDQNSSNTQFYHQDPLFEQSLCSGLYSSNTLLHCPSSRNRNCEHAKTLGTKCL